MGIGINIKSKVLEFFYDYKMYIGNSIDDVKNGFGIFYLRINNLKIFGKKENNMNWLSKKEWNKKDNIS